VTLWGATREKRGKIHVKAAWRENLNLGLSEPARRMPQIATCIFTATPLRARAVNDGTSFCLKKWLKGGT